MNSYELLSAEELITSALKEIQATRQGLHNQPVKKREEIENRLKKAEEMLGFGRAKAAKELGFKIHDCKLPPGVLLWDESRQGHVCDNCGHFRPKPQIVRSRGSSWLAARGGRNDWMGN